MRVALMMKMVQVSRLICGFVEQLPNRRPSSISSYPRPATKEEENDLNE
jgi:hypothetical protein